MRISSWIKEINYKKVDLYLHVLAKNLFKETFNRGKIFGKKKK